MNPLSGQSAIVSERLALRAAAGDRSALAELFERHADAVYNYVQRRVRSVQAAEEVVGDVWIRVVRGIHRYTSGGDGYFIRWLCTIAKNVICSKWKQQQRRPDLAPEMLLLHRPSNDAGPEEVAERRELARAVVAAMGALTDKQRECLTLRYFDGLSEAQTAAVMGLTLGSVKQLHLRGLRALRRTLGPNPHAVMTRTVTVPAPSTAPRKEVGR